MKNTSTTEARNNHRTQFEDNSHQHHHPEIETAPPDLDGLLRRLASDKTSTLPALDLLLPNEALTLENVAAMFEQFGWPAQISGERILLRVGIALQDRSEHLTVRCKRFPSGFRFFWDWYIRRDAKLVEKLRFVNEVNVALSGVGMNYLGAPIGKDGVFTPQPGVVGAFFHLIAIHGLTFNQMTMSVKNIVAATISTAAMARNRGMLDEDRWPSTIIDSFSDVAAECDDYISQSFE